MTTSIVFGTDGWRAIIAEDFTFANVRLCAQGVADYLHERGMAGQGLVVGYDTRFASDSFAGAVAEVLAANEVPVLLCEAPAPTPVVSYSIVDRKAAGAVIITASHNPAAWNGFKYKPEYAGSATPEVTEALERHIARAAGGAGPRSLPLAQARRAGRVQPLDPRPAYLLHLRSLLDVEAVKAAGLRVVVDSMYGAGAGYLATLLEGGATQVVEIHGERNPAFPGLERPEPIAHNLGALREEVLRRGFDVGVATDGDADRVGGVDEKGEFLTPLQFFALLAQYLLEVRGQRGPLVRSITTSSMIDRLGELHGVPVHQTPVGFKYVGPKMLETQAIMGGEESGGFGFRGHIPERDGVLSGLLLLDFMARTGRKPSGLVEDLYRRVGPHYYDRWDLPFEAGSRSAIVERVSAAQPTALGAFRVVGQERLDGFFYRLEGGAWLLVRFSGTEPLLRIYAEADSPERVARLLTEGRRLAGV